MNENQIKGTAKDIAGKVQETAGQVVGSNSQQAKGLAKQVKLPMPLGDLACKNAEHGVWLHQTKEWVACKFDKWIDLQKTSWLDPCNMRVAGWTTEKQACLAHTVFD